MELSSPRFELETERLGPLPVVNHFLDRMGLDELLAKSVASADRMTGLPYAKALGVLLRSILVERDPVYRQQETVQTFAPGMFGVAEEDVRQLSDDRIGRALDRLFDADRGTFMTEVVVRVAERFGVEFKQLHNDSTSIRFTGQYRGAAGRSIRGRRAPWITYGYSKDHRPDLKQLLFVLTTSADGGLPVQFRCEDGNTNDTRTHIETWETLRRVAGRPDFLYVADCKLCTRENMDYIDRHGGRFITVMPRSRLEDEEFRKWIQKEEPAWELVWDRQNPRRKGGPRDRWWVYRYPIPSREGWPVIWVFSSLLALRQERVRREHLQMALEELGDLKRRLTGPKARRRKGKEIDLQVREMIARLHVGRYLKVRRTIRKDYRFIQHHRGRPGPDTSYRRKLRRRWDIEWEMDESLVAYDRKSDGMYPLLTNDRKLLPAAVLEGHKGQPTIEKRFQQCKNIHEIAPVLLKNEGRIEALFFLYFLALLVQALIERELRTAMRRKHIQELPIYPEDRLCSRPTTEQVMRLFSLAGRHHLIRRDKKVQTFLPELTSLQRQVLRLLGVPAQAYCRA